MATQVETTPSHALPLSTSSPSRRSPSLKKPWHSRHYPSARRSLQLSAEQETESLSRQNTQRSTASTRRQPKWWKVRLFRGMIDDVKRRVPYYWSDWKDAWDYRVVPATVYMYFAKYGSLVTNSLHVKICSGIYHVFHFCPSTPARRTLSCQCGDMKIHSNRCTST
jgi:HCO3- transporter family